MSLFNQDYFIRHAALEREAGLRATNTTTSQMHEDAARLYDALAAARKVAGPR